jgi:hypothetical protein
VYPPRPIWILADLNFLAKTKLPLGDYVGVGRAGP